MSISRINILISCSVFGLAVSVSAQTIVYTGRHYLKKGRSWPEIREFDLATGRDLQLTATSRTHWSPWCAPDHRSILFLTSSDKGLYRFDRITKREDLLLTLDEVPFNIIGAIDQSKIIVESTNGTIQIIDTSTKATIRRISGGNPALSPNRAMLAWQTPGDTLLHPEQKIHVLPFGINNAGQLDLGEGSSPAFTPDSSNIVFVRFDEPNHRLDLVRHDLVSKSQSVQATAAPDIYRVYGLTLSTSGSTFVLAACCGDHGSDLYWWLLPDQTWSLIDQNLDPWGGWSRNGLLIYATDGHQLRPLDANRNVWVGDIRLFDSNTGKIRTIVQGTSYNSGPRWCTDDTKSRP